MTEAPTCPSPERLHADELAIDAGLVRRLLADQFPCWDHLPLTPVPSGTDNLTFRLGGDMAVRLPRMASAAVRLRKELRWLPYIASALPLAAPVPLAEGSPSPDYPLPWAVTRWVPGESAAHSPVTDLAETARVLAAFVTALRAIPSDDGPPPGEHNSRRGVPLTERDEEARAAIEALRGIIDGDAAAAAWDQALAAPPWDGPPGWIHGDLHASNLVICDHRLAAVVDFGCLGVGDPACDLMVAWTYLEPRSRRVFRAAVRSDEASWKRGRGWALSVGLIALPYYRGRDALMEAMADHAIGQVLAEHEEER